MGTGTIIGLSILGAILLFLSLGTNILEEEIEKEKPDCNEDKNKK